jgi:hypothetical protein
MKNQTIFCLLAVLFSDISPITRIVDLYQLEAQDLET